MITNIGAVARVRSVKNLSSLASGLVPRRPIDNRGGLSVSNAIKFRRPPVISGSRGRELDRLLIRSNDPLVNNDVLLNSEVLSLTVVILATAVNLPWVSSTMCGQRPRRLPSAPDNKHNYLGVMTGPLTLR